MFGYLNVMIAYVGHIEDLWETTDLVWLLWVRDKTKQTMYMWYIVCLYKHHTMCPKCIFTQYFTKVGNK